MTKGRPKGTTNPMGRRKQRQLRAYDDEWEIIKRMASLLKNGYREKCIEFIENIK